MTSPAVLSARGLGRRAGTRQILSGVDATVSAGQIHAVMGASGSGKTTLLRLLAGLDVPDQGTVEHAPGRRIVYVHQRPEDALLTGTITDELAIGRLHGIAATAEIDPAALLARLGIPDELHGAHLHRLPGGTRRLVAIAAAVVSAPDILLLDEPTSGLSPAARWRVIDLLAGLAGAGTAILVATHDIRLAMAAATHLMVLDRGSARFAGSATEVLHDAERSAELGLEPAAEAAAAARVSQRSGVPVPAWREPAAVLDWLARTIRSGGAGGG